MNVRLTLAAVGGSLLVTGMLGLSGCASVSAHMPWRHKAPPPPEVATALTVATPAGAAVTWPQFWLRNDVVLDMSGVAGSGSAVIAPRSGLAWPVRVALRVAPGTIGAVDVTGAQRWVVPVPVSGAAPVDFELPPGVYLSTTRQIVVNWRPAASPAAP